MARVVVSQVVWEAMFEIVDDEGFVLEKRRGNGVIHPFNEENCAGIYVTVCDTKDSLEEELEKQEAAAVPPTRTARNGRSSKARRVRPPVETPTPA